MTRAGCLDDPIWAKAYSDHGRIENQLGWMPPTINSVRGTGGPYVCGGSRALIPRGGVGRKSPHWSRCGELGVDSSTFTNISFVQTTWHRRLNTGRHW